MEFLLRMIEQAQDAHMRDALQQRLREVVSERDIRFLEEGVSRYQARHGRSPETLADLVKGDIIAEIPPSPFSEPYVLDRSNGRVSNPRLRERLQVHRHVDCQTVKRSAPAQGPGLISQSPVDGK
jgi:hypothetical protein